MADFTGATLERADLRCTDFTGARMGGVNLQDADVDDVIGLTVAKATVPCAAG
jgi:uncharacterized protein YjbI with pentapeptide repeats